MADHHVTTTASAEPVSGQTFLAFDYGLKRTGVASGNRFITDCP